MASAAHAKVHTLLAGKESTYGTNVAADKDLGLIQSFTPSDKRTYEKVKATGSREIQQLVAAKEEYTADIELFLQNGRVFEYLLGTKDSSTPTSGDNKHIFSIGATIPSFSIENSFNLSTDIVADYSGNKIQTGTVSVDTDGIIKFTGSIIGKDLDISGSTAASAVISTLDVLAFKHSSVSTGSAGSETSVGKVQSWSVTFDNTLQPIPSAGNTQIQCLEAGGSEITFEFQILFENTTEYQKFLGGTGSTSQPASTSLVINANNGVALGSGRREFNVQLTGVQYEEFGAPITVGESVFATFRGSATGLGTDKLFVVDTVTGAAF